MNHPRFMLAAPASGSGKTLITCGILQVLANRGLHPASFKCGPDYIDPLFHEKVLGEKSHNLDSFFFDTPTLNYLFKKGSADHEISVVEGVMGYYDGIAGISTDGSAYHIAKTTNTPTILIVNARGSSVSLAALIQGFKNFRQDSHIQGVILNQTTQMLYPRIKAFIEEETGVAVVGFVPKLTDISLESRHLGLILPHEIEDIQNQLQRLASILENTLDFDAILNIASNTPPLSSDFLPPDHHFPLTIGVAADEAFCFTYSDNLDLMQQWGVKLKFFSPLSDEKLPEHIHGLILSGGYPELHAQTLSNNTAMLRSIQSAIEQGLPTIAECGGFMYLHREMEDMDGISHKMVGVIDGKAIKTQKLSRFGYITLENAIVFGEPVGDVPAHEFHYFDSTQIGDDFKAQKPQSKRGWSTGHATDTLLAGFPHIHFFGNLKVLSSFLTQCEQQNNMCFPTEKRS